MAKQNKNIQKKGPSSAEHGKVIPIDALKKRYMDQLSEPLSEETTLVQFAAASYNMLKEDFANICDMKMYETPAGTFKIGLTKKGIQEKSVAQIEITITKDFRYNIHLNDYEHFDEYYRFQRKLTSVDLIKETANFRTFIDGNALPKDHKREKVEY